MFDRDESFFSVEAGLPNLARKLCAGESTRIGYMGGSFVVQKDGWRPAVHRWIEAQYPTKHGHQQIIAALGATPSTVSPILLDRLLSGNPPDAIFVDFFVNDQNWFLLRRELPPDLLASSVEGIVQLVQEKAPTCDLFFVHTTNRWYVELKLRTDRILDEPLPGQESDTSEYFDLDTNYVHMSYGLCAQRHRLPQVWIHKYWMRRIAQEGLNLDDSFLKEDLLHLSPLGVQQVREATVHALQHALQLQSRGSPPANRVNRGGLRVPTFRRIDPATIAGPCNASTFTSSLATEPFFELDINSQITVPVHHGLLGLFVVIDEESGYVGCECNGQTVVRCVYDRWASRRPRLGAVLFPELRSLAKPAEVTIKLLAEKPSAALDKSSKLSQTPVKPLGECKLRIVGLLEYRDV